MTSLYVAVVEINAGPAARCATCGAALRWPGKATVYLHVEPGKPAHVLHMDCAKHPVQTRV